MSISRSIKYHANKKWTNQKPLWLGPQNDSDRGGISQSMLGRFLVDRERFRIRYIEGLQSQDSFQHRIEYGNLWHLCEENAVTGGDWEAALASYRKTLVDKYPMQQTEISKWYNVCKVQFPVYLNYWKRHSALPKSESVLREHVFHVQYVLPDKRIVWLKGKFDGLDFFKVNPSTFKKEDGLWLIEHKTKGDVDEIAIQNQLRFDLQTMLYLVALDCMKDNAFWNRSHKKWRGLPIKGVLYNIVRRPLSGGEGSIRKHKPTKKKPKAETDAEFYARLSKDYLERHPERWFMRLLVDISPADIVYFRRKFLDPILIQLCDWYQCIIGPGDSFGDMYGLHWQMPYGIFNPLSEGKGTDVDNYMLTGNELGLQCVDELFTELK